MKVLFVASEAYPLIKTGGLADVAASLPRALLSRGHSVRLLLPAYPQVLENARARGLKAVAQLPLGDRTLTLWQTRLPGTRVTVWLVDTPGFSEREGNPYVDAQGVDWPDNHHRFLDFCAAAVDIAMDRAGLQWRADLVHANDWQAGPVCALLEQEPLRPARVFTVHNLSYHGLFSYAHFAELPLPPPLAQTLWHPEAMEFYDQFSFIKGGLMFADQLTTVSPSYAREIQTPEYGCGLDGVLRARRAVLTGIVNGIDTREWNPGRDPHLSQRYNRRSLSAKSANKIALQARMGLAPETAKPLLGFIGRLVEQKGIDWLLAALPPVLARNECQVVLLGSGAAHYQESLQQLQKRYPEQVALHIGYDEALAHQIEAGADLFLMPSMFEPCGLNQLYSLRYGTLPLVHAVGGLKDTVCDLPPEQASTPDTRSNGFCFHQPRSEALAQALSRALTLFVREPDQWRQRQLNAMAGDFSWERSAAGYETVYHRALASTCDDRSTQPAPFQDQPR